MPLDVDQIVSIGKTAQLAESIYEAAGYEVQTKRLATPPFPELFSGLKPGQILDAVRELEQIAAMAGFEYTSIGPALIGNPESYSLIPEIIAATENVFCSAQMATTSHGISLAAVKACAEIITRLAPQEDDGFANLYFTALVNVGPGAPFFPAAYHDKSRPAFALALEAADLAVSAFEEAADLESGLNTLRKMIEHHAQILSEAASKVQANTGLEFNGIDFSMAPFPAEARSLGAAVERIGVPKIGEHGSLAAAAMLASTLDRARFHRVGFSGLLFPQLEDSVLALRASEGFLTVKDLLMYSAVCGTGLDTIPLPGDTTAGQLSALLLDLAALGMRLDKPLTARLMPIPGKKVGDQTSFDFDYFANSAVMPLNSSGLQSFLDGDGKVTIQPRKNEQPKKT